LYGLGAQRDGLRRPIRSARDALGQQKAALMRLFRLIPFPLTVLNFLVFFLSLLARSDPEIDASHWSVAMLSAIRPSILR
jgi:hypothetical protein